MYEIKDYNNILFPVFYKVTDAKMYLFGLIFAIKPTRIWYLKWFQLWIISFE